MKRPGIQIFNLAAKIHECKGRQEFIHPFNEGNGRISRSGIRSLIATAILAVREQKNQKKLNHGIKMIKKGES
ncbi:Fic/DOC family protein [[Clostridium] aminophilum]|uniref:Fic/DOC family protein n=1 Tax=[Clostridium] aminophilum TaxID=1526 RepID=A0A1I0ELR3_9FIRM|nr:Fic/DOC family protein [[Clostridium] aminophilum]